MDVREYVCMHYERMCVDDTANDMTDVNGIMSKFFVYHFFVSEKSDHGKGQDSCDEMDSSTHTPHTIASTHTHRG